MLQTAYIEQDPEAVTEVSSETLAKRQRQAWQLCAGALNVTSWLLADKQARRWLGQDCGCSSLGIPKPKE